MTIKKKTKAKKSLPKPGKRGAPNGEPLSEWDRQGLDALALAADIETLWRNQQWPISTSVAVAFIAKLLRLWADVWDSKEYGHAMRLHIAGVVRQLYGKVQMPYMPASEMDRWWAVEKRLPEGVVKGLKK